MKAPHPLSTSIYITTIFYWRKYNNEFKKVGYGTPETPTHLDFQYKYQKKQLKDSSMEVGICGTNVTTSLRKQFDFSNFFTVKIRGTVSLYLIACGLP